MTLTQMKQLMLQAYAAEYAFLAWQARDRSNVKLSRAARRISREERSKFVNLSVELGASDALFKAIMKRASE